MEALTIVNTVGFDVTTTSGDATGQAASADAPYSFRAAAAAAAAATATAAAVIDAPAGRGGVTPASWPGEVELILSAMDVAHAGDEQTPVVETPLNRRSANRAPYRVRARLQLFSDRPGTPPWILYTRDVSPRSLGFITPHRLPLGYGGWVEIPTPRGGTIKVHCTLFRCREAVKGWFEGALSFNREQHAFDRA